ncbi:isochorismate synthase [Lentibacillus sp. L22]|uniref:isochorismate synthase n=1 Tax=Lentibacillus TaxID=175304 RepID=UPI0022B1DD0E|nr:isochorismate synthase [Lentibacillus daqui]
MIETKEKLLEVVLDEAIHHANETKSKQLVSFTKKIDQVNPLQFFEAAKTCDMNRTFWASTADAFYLVGIGTVYPLVAGENRLKDIEQQWNELTANATVHNPYQVPGTGLVALGGMCFDPKKQTTGLWDKFRNSEFQVPRYTLVQTKQASYVTINTFVTMNDSPRTLAQMLEETEKNLLHYTKPFPDEATLLKREEIAPQQWKEQVRQATEEIKQQHAEKIVLAREMRLTFSKQVEVTPVLDKLLSSQTNSYVFAFEHGDDCFVGATPERLVKLEQEQLLSTCLAGTAPRGTTPVQDKEIGRTLLQDTKNREEHDFVVKMIGNAIKPYCSRVDIPNNPVIYPLKNLQHLYTPVKATLKQGHSIFEIVKALHPTPALGGVPREKSLTFIREHELLERGWYGAPVGWLDSNRNGEFAVAIRSGLVQGNEASIFAGCGVVKDSDPEAEYEETLIKFTPMLSVLGGS